MLIALIVGVSLGFISAIPVAGPVSAVIFSRGMRGKYAQGRWIALGAAFIEAIYAFLAFWGFSHYLANLSFIFDLSNGVAAVLLAALGVYFYRSQKLRRPVHDQSQAETQGGKGLILGVGMSLVNPTLIATWTAVVTTLFSMHLFEFTELNGAFFALGVCGGILAWFALFLEILARHRDEMSGKFLDRGLKGVGILLGGLSLWILVRIALKLIAQ